MLIGIDKAMNAWKDVYTADKKFMDTMREILG